MSLAAASVRCDQRPMRFRLKELRLAREFTQEQMAEMMGISVGLYNGLEQGKRRMNADYIESASDIFKISPRDLIDEAPDLIAVPGQAGAGDEVFLVDDYVKGDGNYHVECPPQLSPHGIVAVEVKGQSMEPVYSEGDLLFYSRATADGVPSEAIGRRVIAQTDDGRVWVKFLKEGSEKGIFNLLSLNPLGRNLNDVHVIWAAPVRMHLPKEFVKKVD